MNEEPPAAAPRPADDDDVGRAAGEQADADHAGDLVELGLQAHRIGDGQVVHVQDPVAVVGDYPVAPYRLAAGQRHGHGALDPVAVRQPGADAVQHGPPAVTAGDD